MSEPERRVPRRFVVDTNVFVAAIKSFSKQGRESSAVTGSLTLLLRLINDTEFELFADLLLLDEYRRLEAELNSKTGTIILNELTTRMHEVTKLTEKAVERCRPYLPEEEAADVLHAATALQSKAVLISNDRDFERIGDSGLIEVWSTSEAIRRLLAKA